jgi:hypothetical protein
MNYVLGKRILNILNHVIFPRENTNIDLSVFMLDLRMINMSSECEYDWYWKISACSTEYEVCDSFASLTPDQASYSGSAGRYFRYQSIHIQITYTYPSRWKWPKLQLYFSEKSRNRHRWDCFHLVSSVTSAIYSHRSLCKNPVLADCYMHTRGIQ